MKKIDISLLAIALAVVVLCGQFLLGGKVLFWGVPLLQFYPWRLEAWREISAGFLPLWNPDLGMGAPLLANAQSALLYPPNALLFLIPMDYAQSILLAGHLVLAGWGMSRLVRELSIGRLGQAAAGLAFALCGYVFARAWFFSINAAVAWLPWIILAGERLVKRPGLRPTVWLTLALVMQWLAGHWQTAWYTGWLLALWITVRAVQLPLAQITPPWKRIASTWMWAALAGAAAFGLSAAQVLPTAEYWLNSQRASGMDPSLAATYSFWPWRLLELAAPGAFGNPAYGNYHGYGNYWEDAVYIGILTLALAVAAVVNRFRRRGLANYPYGICLALILMAFPLAMGSWAPWFAFFEHWVPEWNIFQAPTRVTLWAEFGLVMLAAAGIEQWQRAPTMDFRRLGRLGAAALALFLGGLLGPMFTSINVSLAHGFATTGGILFLGVCLWALKPEMTENAFPGRAWPSAVLLVIAADLMLADRGLLPAGSADIYENPNPAAPAITETLQGERTYMSESIRYVQTYSRFIRFDTFSAATDGMQMRAVELPNVNILDGIPSANNFDPFVPARYADFLAALEKMPADNQPRIWRMMDVGGVWRGGGESTSPAFVPVADSLGRAWGVCAAEWSLGPEDSKQAILDPGFDPAARVILEIGKGTEGGPCSVRPLVSVEKSPDPNRVTVRAQFSEAGFLVLADVNYPGWEAFLDGEQVPLLQADYAFRAVRMPAGSHVVEFQYRPLSFWAGVKISVIAGVVILLWAAVQFFQRQKIVETDTE